MNKRLGFLSFLLAVLFASRSANAQFTDPRNYDDSPVGVNELELSYAYVRADASIDTSLVVTGAAFNINQGNIDYKRYLGLFHRLMWVEAAVPIAGFGGSIAGTSIHGSTTGAGDSSYGVATLLKGGPALSIEKFSDYKQTTTLGISLTVTAPTGSYQPNKILNLGSDRWSLKPEVAISHPFGPMQKWEADAYGNIYFYTDNTSYHGRELLRQGPLYGLEGHVSYSFIDSLWASIDARYSFRGTTAINGVDQKNAQQNFILGSEVNLSMSSRNSLVFEFARALVHQNGPASTGVAVKYSYSWGKDYR